MPDHGKSYLKAKFEASIKPVILHGLHLMQQVIVKTSSFEVFANCYLVLLLGSNLCTEQAQTVPSGCPKEETESKQSQTVPSIR